MNIEMLWGVLRAILAALGGVAVSKGYIDNDTLTAVLGAIGTIVIAIWSVVAKWGAKTVIAGK